MTKSALVLAGGGVAGIAWELGVLYGIQQQDPALVDRILAESTTFVGTSAGSSVAAQVASGTPLADLYASQLVASSTELSVDVNLTEFGAMMMKALDGASSPEESRQRIGRIALDAQTVPAADRRAVIAARLPSHDWPTRTMLITAIDTATGDLRVFDRNSGVELVDAVSASCAVPGVWPTVEIEGKRYMDGGMRSVANSDLAAGADQVLILTPAPPVSPMGQSLPQAELDALAPARIHTVFADDASIAAFGPNPLDPSVRRPSAEAGLAVGHRIAADVAAFWS